MEGGQTHVRGKTGHLRHVSSLSGLLPGAGEWLVFSVLVNGARGSSLDVDAAIDAFIADLSASESLSSISAGGATGGGR